MALRRLASCGCLAFVLAFSSIGANAQAPTMPGNVVTQGYPTYVVALDPRYVSAVQARLAELRRQRSSHRLGGPIATMSVGGGVALIGLSSVLASSLGLAFEGETSDSGRSFRRAVRISSLVAVSGGVLVVVGGVRLGQRLRLRRTFDPELLRLRDELRGYGIRAFGIDAGIGYAAGRLQFGF